jgi:hypothetical protein
MILRNHQFKKQKMTKNSIFNLIIVTTHQIITTTLIMALITPITINTAIILMTIPTQEVLKCQPV